MISVQTDLDPAEWDWDYEVSHDHARMMIDTLQAGPLPFPKRSPYSPHDYRFRVHNTESQIVQLRECSARSQLSAHFINMAQVALRLDTMTTTAFKYIARTPLKVNSVCFI